MTDVEKSFIPSSSNILPKAIAWHIRILPFLAKQRYRIRSLVRAGFAILESTAITVIVVLLMSISIILTDSSVLSKAIGVGSILTQVAATIGTVVAIVFGLALAPVQRAAEALSPAVLQVYARDRRIRSLFIALGTLCIAVFILSFEGIARITGSWSFAAGILLIAIALDLLRWFYRLTLEMLNPLQAVQLATREAIRVVHALNKYAHETAVLSNKFSVQPGSQHGDVNDWKGVLLNTPSFSRPVNYWLEALSEIGKKAAETGQVKLAKASLEGLASVVCEYLTLRKGDLRTGADPHPAGMFLVSKSNAETVVRPACELIIDVANVAMRGHNEETAIASVEQLTRIALVATQSGGQKYEPWRGSLASTPIGYLGQLFKAAREAKHQEVVFQGSGLLRHLLGDLPIDESRPEVRTTIIQVFSDNAVFFYANGTPALAEEVLAYLCEGIHRQYEKGSLDTQEMLGDFLKKLPFLAQIGQLSHAKFCDVLSLTCPLDGALSLVRETSLPYLLAKQLFASALDPEGKRINPYSEFSGSLSSLQQTFRTIAETSEFDSATRLLHEMCEVIYYIGTTIAQQLDEPLDKAFDHEEELVNELNRLVSTLWVAFYKKQVINVNNCQTCCDTASAIGLIGLRFGYTKLACTAVSTIKSIVEHLMLESLNISAYTVADCLVHIDYICLGAEHLGMEDFAKAKKSIREKLPTGIKQADWNEVQEAVLHRLQQFEERRTQYGYRPGSYLHAEGELQTLIDDTQQATADAEKID